MTKDEALNVLKQAISLWGSLIDKDDECSCYRCIEDREALAIYRKATKNRRYSAHSAIGYTGDHAVFSPQELEAALEAWKIARWQKPVAFVMPNGDLQRTNEARTADEWGTKCTPLYASPVVNGITKYEALKVAIEALQYSEASYINTGQCPLRKVREAIKICQEAQND